MLKHLSFFQSEVYILLEEENKMVLLGSKTSCWDLLSQCFHQFFHLIILRLWTLFTFSFIKNFIFTTEHLNQKIQKNTETNKQQMMISIPYFLQGSIIDRTPFHDK